jgi:hypothetical protein
MVLTNEFLSTKMMKNVFSYVFLKLIQTKLKIFNYDTLIIKCEENIKYLYLHVLMLKIIFRISEMIKHFLMFESIDSSLKEQSNKSIFWFIYENFVTKIK